MHWKFLNNLAIASWAANPALPTQGWHFWMKSSLATCFLRQLNHHLQKFWIEAELCFDSPSECLKRYVFNVLMGTPAKDVKLLKVAVWDILAILGYRRPRSQRRFDFVFQDVQTWGWGVCTQRNPTFRSSYKPSRSDASKVAWWSWCLFLALLMDGTVGNLCDFGWW